MFLLRRPFIFILLLAAAGAVPYLLMSGNGLSGWMDNWQSNADDGATSVGDHGPMNDGSMDFDGDSRPVGPRVAGATQRGFAAGSPQLGGPPSSDLHEAFDFRISPAWVTSRWARVTTTLAESDLEGMRVPLVTGTRVDDLHGSLTYYFDNQHRVQRITFFGHTGNPNRLIALLTQYHGFRPEPTLRAGLYLRRWNGKPTSGLWLDHVAQVSASAPHSQIEVRLEINRTDNPLGLSEEFSSFLDVEKQLGRR